MGFRVILSLALIKCVVMGLVVKDPAEAVFALKSPSIMNGPMSCACSATNRGYPKEALDIMKTGLDNLQEGVTKANIFDESEVEALKEHLEKAALACFKKFGTEACVNADKKLRKGGRFYCMHEMRNGKNVHLKNKEFLTVGPCSSNIKTASTETQLGDPINEGCVAIEHIKGYYTLHRNDMMRRVLCVPEIDFCATPNHALLIDGKWSSLKKMCTKEGWECTEEERLVNNLNFLFRTRLRFNDRIVITPYDASWPIFCTAIAQIIEMTWNVTLQIITIIFVTALLLVTHGILATNGHLSLTGTTPLETVLSRSPRGVQDFANGVFDSFSKDTNEDGTEEFSTPRPGTTLLANSPRMVQRVCEFSLNMIENIRGNAETKRIGPPQPKEEEKKAEPIEVKPTVVPDSTNVDSGTAAKFAALPKVTVGDVDVGVPPAMPKVVSPKKFVKPEVKTEITPVVNSSESNKEVTPPEKSPQVKKEE